MENTLTETAAPSPALTFESPTDPAANLEWRKTGELPAAPAKEAKPKADSTPAKPASPDKTGEIAPASAPGTKQEPKAETNTAKSAAALRLDEILADLKRAGFTPDELKTFRREAKAAETGAPQPAELVEPKEPDTSGMTWEEGQAAEKKYFKEFMAYTAQKAVLEDRQARAVEAQNQVWNGKVEEATARYGEQTKSVLIDSTAAIKAAGIPAAVEQVLGESPVFMDVLYVLGTKAEELTSFLALAKSNPRAAIRKIILMEQLVEQELAKPGSAAAGGDKGEATGATDRDEHGKFVSPTPAKKKPAAPPPAEELSTRGSVSPDPKEAAVRNNDFAAFKAAEDREDLARRRGA